MSLKISAVKAARSAMIADGSLRKGALNCAVQAYNAMAPMIEKEGRKAELRLMLAEIEMLLGEPVLQRLNPGVAPALRGFKAIIEGRLSAFQSDDFGANAPDETA